MCARKRVDILLEDVRVEAVAAEGRALFHTQEGIVVFIDNAVPGDIVDVRVLKKKKNYMEGRIIKLKTPSDIRQEPFCPHFGVCGGCKWQTLPYELQLQAKQQQVYDQLVRIGHLEIPEISPIIGSEHTEYYRNKLEYTFSSRRWLLEGEDPDSVAPDDRCALGFHVGKFFDKVLDIKDCHLQADPSNAIRLFIKQYAIANSLEFYDIRENHGFLRNIVIRNTPDGQIMLIAVFARNDETAVKGLLDALIAQFPQITSLYYVINEKVNDSISDQRCILYHGSPDICETMEGLHFRVGPKSFFQTNSTQAYRLYKAVRELANLSGGETVYDLYTGTGTIAQFVSAKASKVIGIEYVPEAIEDARANTAANGITNCTYYAGDMKDILTTGFIQANGRPDVIILDPPRAGIHPDVAKVILEAEPGRIVYVSCNPASQARDLAILGEKYTVTAVQPVDMFPHTQHVENICALTLRQ